MSPAAEWAAAREAAGSGLDVLLGEEPAAGGQHEHGGRAERVRDDRGAHHAHDRAGAHHHDAAHHGTDPAVVTGPLQGPAPTRPAPGRTPTASTSPTP